MEHFKNIKAAARSTTIGHTMLQEFAPQTPGRSDPLGKAALKAKVFRVTATD